MKKIIRDKLSDYLMISGLVISFLLIFNVSSMLVSGDETNNDVSSYNFEMYLDLKPIDELVHKYNIEQVISFLENQDQGNFLLNGNYGLQMNGIEYIQNTLLIKQNENLRISGIPNNIADVSILVNDNMQPYITDGMITIEKIKFTVAEERLQLEEDSDSLVMFVNYINLPEQKKSFFKSRLDFAIDTGGITLVIGS